MLLSYIWLVCWRSDLRIAQHAGILPLELTREAWVAFVHSLLLTKPGSLDCQTLEGINPRFLYGELRLPRLSTIYRFCSATSTFSVLVRGYRYGYAGYATFLQKNFAWVLTAIVYINVVLTALQVGLATEELRDNAAFSRVSYGFAIFAILAPLVVIGVVGGVLVGVVLFNLLHALKERAGSRATHSELCESVEQLHSQATR